MRKYMIGLVATLLVLVCFGAYAEPPVGIKGSEAGEALLYMWADQGDDADDKAVIAITTGGNLSIRGTSGTNEVFSLDLSTGTLTLDGGITGSGALSGTSITGSGALTLSGSIVAATNAQALASSVSTIVLNNSGLRTNTIANPSASGQHLYITSISTTNTFFAASATNLDANGLTNVVGKIQLNALDVLHLLSTDATSWSGVSFTAN